MNNLILIFNAILYIGTFIFYQKKKKNFDIGSIILLSYSLIAIIGINLFNHPLSHFKDLTFFPFVYLYFVLMIVGYPIFKIENSKISEIQEPTKLWINTFSLIVILAICISSESLITNFNNGFFLIFKNADYVQLAYQDSHENIDKLGDGNFSIINVLSTMFSDFSPMLFFYYLSRKKRNKIICWGLAFTIIVTLIGSISQAARGNLVRIMLNLSFAYLFFYRNMADKTKKIFRYIIIIFCSLITIPFLIITFGRFQGEKDSNDSAEYFAEYYFAQSFLNFNNYGLDAGGVRYGDRTFPLFKEILGMETANNYNKRMGKYKNMKMNESYFSTYVGEFTLDFGPFVALISFVLFAIICRKKLRIKKVCKFSQYILCYFVFNVCVGIFLFQYADIGGNLKIILYILLYIFFKIDYIHQTKKKVIYG